MCTVCVALSCCLSADICAPTLMTSLFNTILKVLAPVTVSHQTYIVSNVSLKKKTEKFSQIPPPPLPTSSVLYTQILWFLAGVTRPRSSFHTRTNTKKTKSDTQTHTHKANSNTLTQTLSNTWRRRDYKLSLFFTMGQCIRLCEKKGINADL